MRRRLIIAMVAFAIVGDGRSLVSAGSATDDQARADAAMEAFGGQMGELGFESTGPPDQDEDTDDFGPCFEGVGTVMTASQEPVEGETARAFSDEFSRTPTELPAGTSDTKPDDEAGDEPELDADGEFAAAIVITFDETHRDAAEEFVTRFGSDEMATCFEQEISDEVAGGGDSTVPEGYELTVDVAADSDLGIGDHSGQLVLTVDLAMMGFELDYSVRYLVAATDRSLVVLLHGTTGAIDAVMDPEVELTMIVEALAG